MKTKKTEKRRIVGFQVLEEECIWMKAGVVNFRKCDNDFDCNTCGFDKGMRRAMGLGAEVDSVTAAAGWVDHLKQRYAGASRPCRHALTGRIEAPKICTMNYECFHCPFDQVLDEMDFSQELETPAYRLASGFKIADGYYYHMGHGWARFEHGGRVRIGFDDFIVKLFGPLGAIELAPLGESLIQDQVGWTFSRSNRKAAVLAPVTGTVLAVNHKVLEHPEIAHEDPYDHGWLMILEPNAPKRNLKKLFFEKESYRWMEQENQKLLGLMGTEYEQLAATGGDLIGDIYGNFPEIGWNLIVEKFLRTSKI